MRAIRIGTRKSELALWQANFVANEIQKLGLETELVLIESYGDENLKQPLYELGVTGVFTKSLDIALLNDKIDIAVHSMKDVPVQLPKGIVKIAVPQRANPRDILVENDAAYNVVATSSLRRKAQWLNRYPSDEITDLRGNVNTRMNKVENNNWKGAIFAKIGLERIGLLPNNYQELDWMIPAPAQGALLVVGKENDKELLEQLSVLNDPKADICTSIERSILHKLEGGCTAPIAALAEFENENSIKVQAGIYSLDGQSKKEVELRFDDLNEETIVSEVVKGLLDTEGASILASIKQAI